jgi:signal transduction histidine kinase
LTQNHGVPPTHIFYRGERADENGVGIGLALAKAIFTAQRGAGTSFEIRVFREVV